jgi:hypothetical protein
MPWRRYALPVPKIQLMSIVPSRFGDVEANRVIRRERGAAMRRRLMVVLVSGLLLGLLALQPAEGAATRASQQRGVVPVGMTAVATPRDTVRSSTTPAVFVPSQLECTATRTGFNTNLDCDDPFPNNEPDIEVDPADPKRMVASSNDYGSCCDQFYTTFDAGKTWQTGNMSVEDPGRTGSDPVTTFDVKTGTVLHSSLNFTFNEDGTQTCRRRPGRLAVQGRRPHLGRAGGGGRRGRL